MKLADCTPDIVNRLTTRSPASNTSSIVSNGPPLPGIERFAQALLVPSYDACLIQRFRRISVQQHTLVVHIQVSVEVTSVPVFDGVIEDFKIADWIDRQESPRSAMKVILRSESMAAAIWLEPNLR
jgi:hypothetical protein